MDLTKFAPKLLIAAADFIERHPNGADPMMKSLMADACREAAGPQVAKPARKKRIVVSLAATPVPEDNVAILLRAAGMQRIQKITRKIYGFLLRYQSRAWGAKAVAERVGADHKAVRNGLYNLHRIGALVRVGTGQYRVK